MDAGYLRSLPNRLPAATARGLALRAVELAATARLGLPAWQSTAVFGAIFAAGLVNSLEWSCGHTQVLVATSMGSLVASGCLLVGWDSEPDQPFRSAVRAVLAAVASAVPSLF